MKKTVPPSPKSRRAARAIPQKATPPSRAETPRDLARPLLIVGIGASAGGLEALTQFLEQTPKDTGMAFVVVQHLDPTQKGMLPELLQRATSLKVTQVKDRMRVEPNRVYVIPPDRDLSILHGTLHLLAPVELRGLRLPIDFFLRSLAEDQRERAAGVILSGMGSDGTLGIQAIKESGGVALVQEPASAKFSAMPESAIAAGLVDFVAPAAELATRLVAYRKHLPRALKSQVVLEGKTRDALEKIVILLRNRTRNDFTLYRTSTLHRRVERRMGIHQLAKIDAYIRYLQENPQELDILFKELLIGVTRFFRDPESWRQVARLGLRALLTSRPAGRTLRAWIAGCSTGEEAYSLAMTFVETKKSMKSAAGFSLQIYATDLDKDAIDKARQGLFPENIAADVSPARLARFFVKEPGGYRVSKEIRSMVVFAPHNLIMDPPFTKLDILCCRNLLIYLTPELQKKLFPLFHYCLNPGGVLFLGSAESIGNFTRLFAPLAPRERLFQRKDAAVSETSLDFPAVFVPSPAPPTEAPPLPARTAASLQAVADQLMQTRFAPPAVLVNDQGDILYVSGRTGKYLEPAAGKANWNVIAMAREGLRYELSGAIQEARRKKRAITLRAVRIGPDPGATFADIVVQMLKEPKELLGMILIVFSDTAAPVVVEGRARKHKSAVREARVWELEQQLQLARREVQACREEMQTSQEELRSMNEELQSSNEEMQSTNEELTTSKEEMQSLNEELQTVNTELETKLDELSGANNDMKNLLNSTDIATVFLDQELNLRRFTLQAKTIIKLIPGDIGRPITDLASDLLYPDLVGDAREVLSTLVFSERPITTKDGRWFKVRIMPYRTTENRIDGVVITFADITAAKAVEAGLREKNTHLTDHSARQKIALHEATRGGRGADAGATSPRPRPKTTPQAAGSSARAPRP